jgi:hypothetical protein
VISYYAREWSDFQRSIDTKSLLFQLEFLKVKIHYVMSQALDMVILEAGWIGRDAILMTGINSIIYILSTLPPSDLFSSLPIFLADLRIDGILWIAGVGGRSCFLGLSSCANFLLGIRIISQRLLKMGTALVATGYWMYIDVPQTAKAVVVCVIIFNAAFGYRQVPILAAMRFTN